jgi:hypothetical protein
MPDIGWALATFVLSFFSFLFGVYLGLDENQNDREKMWARGFRDGKNIPSGVTLECIGGRDVPNLPEGHNYFTDGK